MALTASPATDHSRRCRRDQCRGRPCSLDAASAPAPPEPRPNLIEAGRVPPDYTSRARRLRVVPVVGPGTRVNPSQSANSPLDLRGVSDTRRSNDWRRRSPPEGPDHGSRRWAGTSL